MTIRVLIADDQTLIRAGFRVLVDSAEDLVVVGEAADGEQALALARSERADVVLMDIRMPGLDGLEATRRISADKDLAGVKVLVLTTFDLDEYVYLALRAGASGFLGKSVDPDDLLDAIRLVAAGEALLSPLATRALITAFLAQPSRVAAAGAADRLERLTEREREIVALVAEGLSNDQIAARLVISPMTVKTHVNRAMTKLDLRDRAQLVVAAYQSGLVRVGPAD
ncbi:MAG: response regulator transcription factor [Bifidobacteriaceae bacterium]|jgi:DNA-binding NarL/FixJ family response regulator|nr:response regulator transcription factor [Bifidobacteriaceae bacterium]